MELLVGIIGRASGVRGEVRVSIRTDDPDSRFAPGSILGTNHPGFPTLEVVGSRFSGKHFVVKFSEITNRTEAEQLTGRQLFVDAAAVDGEDEGGAPDGFYRHELLGMSAVDTQERNLGKVTDLLWGDFQDLIEVTTDAGEKVLVPFVLEIVPEVDLDAERVVISPPGGLFPGDEPADAREVRKEES